MCHTAIWSETRGTVAQWIGCGAGCFVAGGQQSAATAENGLEDTTDAYHSDAERLNSGVRRSFIAARPLE